MNEIRTVLVLGDIMIDTHIEATSSRIAPEWPLPVCKESNRTHSLGGVGLVVANLASLVYKVVPVSVIGTDGMGDMVLTLLASQGVATEGIFRIPDRPTTHKTRIFSGNCLLSRLDEEETWFIGNSIKQKIIDFVIEKIAICSVALVVDYRKGVVTENIINNIKVNTKIGNIPIYADPKCSIERFQDIHTLKLNFSEFLTTVNCESKDNPTQSQLKDICRKYKLGRLFVTLGENGITGYDSLTDTFVKVDGNKAGLSMYREQVMLY